MISKRSEDGSRRRSQTLDACEEGSEELRQVLSYHFLPGKWPKEKFKDGMLVKTALKEPGLGGDHQVLSVDVSVDDGKPEKGVSISFGGVSVMGEACK